MKLWSDIVSLRTGFWWRRFRASACAPLVFFACFTCYTSAHAVSIEITVGELTSVATRLKEVVYVNDPAKPRITFQLGLVKSVSSFDTGKYDIYYGVVLPDKTILSWLPDARPDYPLFTVGVGLQPLVRNASLEVTERPIEILKASTAAGYAFSPGDPLGEYQIFCIVVRPGTNPGEMRNWAGFASKILTVQ